MSSENGALQELEAMRSTRRFFARLGGGAVALFLFYVSGFIIAESHSGLAAIAIMIACPSAYFIPVLMVDVAHRRALEELRRASPRLTAGVPVTPVAMSGGTDPSDS